MSQRVAIFTALIGGYDNIWQPDVVSEKFDYYLFTDDFEEKQIGVWNVRHIDYVNPDKTRIARYVKTHPHTLLPEYEATLWIDANLEIKTDFVYTRTIQLIKDKIELASIKHPARNCIYDEAYKVYGLDYEKNIFYWCHYLRSVNYPRQNGLYETNVLFRKNSILMSKVNEEWWDIIEHYSRRDQLALNFLLWKSGIDYVYFLSPNEHSGNSKHIQKRQHGRQSLSLGRRSIPQTRLEHYRQRCRVELQSKQQTFSKIYFFLYRMPIPIGYLFLNLWTIMLILIYGPYVKYMAYKRRKLKNRNQ